MCFRFLFKFCLENIVTNQENFLFYMYPIRYEEHSFEFAMCFCFLFKLYLENIVTNPENFAFYMYPIRYEERSFEFAMCFLFSIQTLFRKYSD